ncbi:zinc finger CCHC domain-containing protein 14 [Astyanax mexicanus]|uniref:zinc finger CCHC domain-containing protein 14 n=1 Tax=Astyanax mexicanus TaxID=7994 RepID=UPI0020CAF1B3|nr:zinc finger CCHC domain-containing protein 14 [Astyanax mexicanus]
MVEGRCCLQREEVYRWFSGLNSAQRAEFLCGILDLCVPVELRFLGSCLEDLARKDYHSLRDAEIKANNPADLAHLANITDEVVRSKLLVSLALLSSDNRAAAAVLFRTLTHIDAVIHNYGLQLNDGRTGEQFLLLFTMASNHPAFSFHQKQVLRQQLTQLQEILQVTGGEPAPSASVPAYLSPNGHLIYRGGPCPCCAKPLQQDVTTATVDEVMQPTPAPTCQDLPVTVHAVKPGKVRVERIELKGVTHKADTSAEYTLEVLWSDSTLTTVGKTSQELIELVSQLSKLFPDDCLEKFLPQSGLEPAHELDPRCLSSFPLHVLRHDRVRLFFSCSSTPTFPANNLSCLLQYRGASRTVCGVASIQPVINVHAPIPQPSSPHLPPQPTLPLHPALPLVEGTPGQNHTNLAPHLQSQPPIQQQPHSHPQTQSQPSPEQNGILDWLRKLRLHKYYPVFKQLTMEEFLALTEEDLNKYDLTQGAKKKLKTQLELQKEKLEKRYVMSQFPLSCGGVARVTPSSYNGPLTHTHPSSSNTELRVEVESGSLPVLRDSSSSSGYSSAPSSPMTPLSRDASFERAKEPHRRIDSLSEPGEKERPCFLLSAAGSASPCRPTAQVLPVQNDPSLSASHLSSLNLPSLPLLSPGRGMNSARKPRPPPNCSEERPKPTGAGLAVGGRLESLFPGMSVVDSVLQGHQDSLGARGPLAGLRSPPGLMVETSTALTATSNTLHHVSHPPLHLQVSPSPSHPRTNQYPHTASSSSCSSSPSLASKPAFLPVSAVPVATASSVPVAAVSGNAYSINSPSIAPLSSSPISTEAVGYGSGQANGASSGSAVCVCSSCGCSGNCGSYGTLPASYGGYFPHPFSGTSVFTLGPLLHFSPLLTGSGSASPFSYPLVAPPLYNSSLSHDSQQNLVLPPVQGFLGGGANIYQPHGIMGNGGTGQKKTGNMSCYNCGLSGHRAQDCKQPPMDSTQQGMFRLKYSPQSDSQDSGD